jgi:chemotaxis protein MotB
MAGKGGGAWKVAYADFVTAMMAFFLVMWITAQNTKIKQAIAHYFNNPSDTTTRPTDAKTYLPHMKSDVPPGTRGPYKGTTGRGRGPAETDPKAPSNADKKGFAARPPSLFVLHDGQRSVTGTVVRFAETSAELSEAEKERLVTDLIPLFVGKPNKIEIRGHSTGRPMPPGGPFKDAWQLSYARCLAVMEHLKAQGIEPARLRLSQAGAFEPSTLAPDRAAQLQNARVEVYMLGEFVDEMTGTVKERAEHYETPWGDSSPSGDPGSP